MEPRITEYPARFRDWFYFPHLNAWTLKWVLWFAVLYAIPFVPYPTNPWGYVENVYVKGWGGIPGFMCLSYSLFVVTVVSLLVFYQSARKRGMFGPRGGAKQ